MTRAATSQLRPVAKAADDVRRVAVVHRQGATCSLLIADASGTVKVIESARLPLEGLSQAVEGRLKAHGVTRLFRIIPGAGTVCRVGSVPAGSMEEVAAAVGFLAEAQLPEALPAHRRGAGVIPESDHGGARSVLLTGWNGSPGEDPARLCGESVEETWVSVPAALAFLRVPGEEVAAYADVNDGSISVIAERSDRVGARVVLEDNTDPTAWSAAFEETLTDAGVGESSARAQRGHALYIEDKTLLRIREEVLGAETDRQWLDHFGVSLGAALLWATRNPASTGLARLHLTPPKRRESVVSHAANWLGSPKRAIPAAVIAALLLLLIPWGTSHARLLILERKAEGLREQKNKRVDLDRKSALYKQLELNRWPMTKLLAHIASATPMEVTVTSLTISPEVGITMQGNAKSQDDVIQLEANLNKLGLFAENFKRKRLDTKSGAGVEFDIAVSPRAAKLHAPFVPFKDADYNGDYASETLAERLYGKGALNTAVEAPVDKNSKTGRRPRSTDSEPRAEERKPSGSELPPPLTADQIAKMDRSTAMKEMVNRSAYIKKTPTLDTATKQRLEDEVSKTKDRLSELNRVQGGAAK